MNNPSKLIGVTRRLPDKCEDRLSRSMSVNWGADEGELSQDDILAIAQGADGMIVTPAERIDKHIICALPESIKVISCFSVGYEHVSIDEAIKRNIVVTNTPGVLTEATADIAWLLILGATRRASEGERLVRSGQWNGWRPTQLMGSQLSGKTLGVLGMGRIGQAVAKRAQGFGMSVIYHNRRRLTGNEVPNARYVDTAEGLLSQSDVLTLHMPLSVETENFLNHQRIELLPDGAFVINTGRGPLVDDNALIEALENGKVSAAGLDVYAGEPELDPRYINLDNVFLLPHLGSATVETREAMGMLAIDNLEAVLLGQEPPYRVV